MSVNAPFGLGKTWYNGRTIDTNDYSGSIHLEGKVCCWDVDKNLTTPPQQRTALPRRSIIVRNVSGIALLPGRICKFSIAGKRVAGYTTVTGEAAAGVVDDSLPSAGVPNGDLFHLMVHGPCAVRKSLSDSDIDLAVDAWVYAITAATSQATTAGRFVGWNGTFSAAQTTDGTAGLILANRIGRAMTTSLTNTTNSQIEIFLDLPYGR